MWTEDETSLSGGRCLCGVARKGLPVEAGLERGKARRTSGPMARHLAEACAEFVVYLKQRLRGIVEKAPPPRPPNGRKYTDWDPVSYTHLDVYKRQAQQAARK